MSDQLEQMKQAQLARKTNLAKWREGRVYPQTLPSGLPVFMRDVTMTDLMLTGKLPEVMLDVLTEKINEKDTELDLRKIAKNGDELNLLMETLVILSIVEPPIADLPDDEHIGIKEISGDDKFFIFQYVNREGEKLLSFRQGQEESVASVQPIDSVLKAAE